MSAGWLEAQTAAGNAAIKISIAHRSIPSL
jgi:hypothetical protein